MVDTIQRFDQPLQPYLDMIEGMRMDLTWTRYSTFEELQVVLLSRGGGTVGLMSERVMGVDPGYTSAPWSTGANTSGAAVALGIANRSPIFSGTLVKIVIVVVFIFLWKIFNDLIIRKSNCLMVL